MQTVLSGVVWCGVAFVTEAGTLQRSRSRCVAQGVGYTAPRHADRATTAMMVCIVGIAAVAAARGVLDVAAYCVRRRTGRLRRLRERRGRRTSHDGRDGGNGCADGARCPPPRAAARKARDTERLGDQHVYRAVGGVVAVSVVRPQAREAGDVRGDDGGLREAPHD
eukprot:gene11364-28312_t